MNSNDASKKWKGRQMQKLWKVSSQNYHIRIMNEFILTIHLIWKENAGVPSFAQSSATQVMDRNRDCRGDRIQDSCQQFPRVEKELCNSGDGSYYNLLGKEHYVRIFNVFNPKMFCKWLKENQQNISLAALKTSSTSDVKGFLRNKIKEL